MTLSYVHTRKACYLAYICQAAINNLPPLLFIIFNTMYGLSYRKLGSLILINFFTQLTVDFIAAGFADKIGYRRLMVAAHLMCAVGFFIFSSAPILPIPIFPALCTGVVVFAVGGGLLEVLVSPIMDSLPAPSEQKAANMSLLHSFYCWGQVGVVLITTLILAAIGGLRWQTLPLIWLVLPLTNAFLFTKVPLVKTAEHGKAEGVFSLFRTPAFWAAMALMMAAGASELTMSQWSSMFAERALGLDKVWGDLAGPCLFAVLMGLGRTFFGVFGARIKLKRFLLLSAVLCFASYLITPLASNPLISLIGCSLCGLSVSIMWPGAFSLSAARFPKGGTFMFGLLAMCGDLGCAFGPWLTGFIAGSSSGGGIIASVGSAIFGAGDFGLKAGILTGIIFPVIIFLVLPTFRKGGGKDAEAMVDPD